MPNKITLKQFVATQKEAPAAAVITPGELLEETSAGKVQPHSSAGGNCVPLIPKAEDYIGNNIDESYSADDQVRYEVGYPGEEYYMFLAAGENVAEGDLLESNGAGAFQAHTLPTASGDSSDIYVDAARFKAAEVVDNSGGAEPIRIKVEVVK